MAAYGGILTTVCWKASSPMRQTSRRHRVDILDTALVLRGLAGGHHLRAVEVLGHKGVLDSQHWKRTS